MTQLENINFLKKDVPMLLNNLQSSSSGKWGQMNAQQMLEHLILAFTVANGERLVLNFITAEEKLPIMKRFLLSDSLFKENTKSPALPLEPMPLIYENIEISKIVFLSELNKVFEVYKNNEDKTIRNPIFGDLNFEEQCALIAKHVSHHFKQFGLL